MSAQPNVPNPNIYSNNFTKSPPSFLNKAKNAAKGALNTVKGVVTGTAGAARNAVGSVSLTSATCNPGQLGSCVGTVAEVGAGCVGAFCTGGKRKTRGNRRGRRTNKKRRTVRRH